MEWNNTRTKLRGLLVMAAVALCLGGCGARSNGGSSDAAGNEVDVPKRDINAVLDAHDEELMEIPGVVGVAVGQLEDQTPALLVLVIEETDEIRRRVPKTIEGHPTKIMVTGEIKPLQDQ